MFHKVHHRFLSLLVLLRLRLLLRRLFLSFPFLCVGPDEAVSYCFRALPKTIDWSNAPTGITRRVSVIHERRLPNTTCNTWMTNRLNTHPIESEPVPSPPPLLRSMLDNNWYMTNCERGGRSAAKKAKTHCTTNCQMCILTSCL